MHFEASKLRIREKKYLDYLDSLERLNQCSPQIIYISPIHRNIISSIQSKSKRYPDVINIGTEKCGTGFLRHILKQHPQFIFPPVKEPNFFSYFWNMGLKEYTRRMPKSSEHEVVMEKSPSYLSFPSTPERMKSVLPNVKLIVILCDPVNRTKSDYVQEMLRDGYQKSTNFDSFIPKMIKSLSGIKSHQDDDAKVINDIRPYTYHLVGSHILPEALYYYHLIRWFKFYDRSRFFIIDGTDLITNPGEVIEELQDFLGIPKLLISEDFEKDDRGFYCLRPVSAIDEMGKRRIVQDQLSCLPSSKGRTRLGRWDYQPSTNTIKMLQEFFHPFNEKLYTLLGRRFKWQ